MKKYDFDTIIDRRGTGAVKTDGLSEQFGRDDLLPMWVADMDFATPDFIVDALKRRLEHPVLGYTTEPDDYRRAIIDWLRELHGLDVKPEWLTYIPGIVKGIGMVINAFLGKDDKVIIQPPVYHPFRIVPEANGREVVMNPLRELPDGSYEMDFENLEKVADERCRMLILSNPHNPAGICWSAATLRRLADFCYQRNILVVADEIHSEMAMPGFRHTPFLSVSESARQCAIAFAAPSKTFNIAGVVSSYAIVPDDGLRTRFFGWLEANELNHPTLFAPIATIAAYRHGREWRRQMLDYVNGNVDFVETYCREYLPEIKVLRPQASFLVWLDCRTLGLSEAELVGLMVGKARVAMNNGAMFGPGGAGHFRLNVGCPRATVKLAMERIREAVASLRQL